MAEPHPIPNHPFFKNLTGQTMPSGVRVLHFLGKGQWLAVCPCGREFRAAGGSLARSKTVRCPECRMASAKPETQACSKCFVVYPFTAEYFQTCRYTRFGLMLRCRPCDNARARSNGRRREQEMRLLILRHYSDGEPRCKCCGETTREFLSLDHIHGGGRTERKKCGNAASFYRSIINRGFPPEYQVLCHNCNLAKGLYGVCPHQSRA